MSMKRTLAVLTAALAPLSAMAASLEKVSGSVLVNRGDGYTIVLGHAELAPGHAIMARASGSALLVYENGCVVEIKPGAVVMVHKEAPCTSSSAYISAIPHILTTQSGITLIVRRTSPSNPISP